MVSTCECLINVVSLDKPTMSGLGPKWQVAGFGVTLSPDMGKTLPAERANLTYHGYISGTW